MRLWRFRRKASRLVGRVDSAVLVDYLQAASALKVDSLADTPLLAVDLELTGLNPSSDHIIAMGWTRIDNGRIQVGSNRHVLVQADKTVGESAVIHGLVDSDVRAGGQIDSALKELLEAAAGRTWVFHHAGLDTAFLNRAFRTCFGHALPFAVLDTLQMERALRNRREVPIQNRDLQLSSLRQDYHLPAYRAHNALVDAYATAELLLAMGAHMSRSEPLKLKPHLQFI